MFKAVSSILLYNSVALASNYEAPPIDPSYSYSYNHYDHPNYLQPKAYVRSPFPEKPASIDPYYANDLISHFKQCKIKRCIQSKESYSEDIQESIAVLGEYTSCVTGCAAEQIFNAFSNYKIFLGNVIRFGSAKLIQARKYLSGEGDYDVIGEGTKIGDTCCLPEEYFSPWENILIPVTLNTFSEDDQVWYLGEGETEPTMHIDIPRMISVKSYLDICTDDIVEEHNGKWSGSLKVVCDSKWVEYLELIQHNVGHLVLDPKKALKAPTCDNDAKENPVGTKFEHDACIAVSYEINGKTGKIETPFLKEIISTAYEELSCPYDTIKTHDETVTFKIFYKRMDKSDIPYYTLDAGLPSSPAFEGIYQINTESHAELVQAVKDGDYTKLTCKYETAIAEESGKFFIKPEYDDTFMNIAINAAKVCPYGGLFEYCNMQQYSSYLQKNIFDNDGCPTFDMRQKSIDTPGSLHTLSCLYKTVSLKCDCMEAVLNCYEHQFSFKDAMASTIGKSASVLCGFILCLKPKIYSLFGGSEAITKANIMRGLLTQVGLSVPSASSMPPATFAFLTFGIGMVAFVATKIISKRKETALYDGYSQLI